MRRVVTRLLVLYALLYGVLCSPEASGGGPVQILHLTDDGKFIVNEDALTLLSNIDKHVSVLTVVGPMRTGKSHFMNQIRGSSRGFAVGPQLAPLTQGLWMWSTPLLTHDKYILLFDTEGFYGSAHAETTDAKLFSLAARISSTVIFNSLNLIEQTSVEYLDLLARRAHLFQTSTAATGANGLESTKFPSLHWVVQSFWQDYGSKTPREWLMEYLTSIRDDDENAPPRSVLALFSDVNITTLPPPCTDLENLKHLDLVPITEFTSDYRDQMASLKEGLFHDVQPKFFGNKAVTGKELSAIIRYMATILSDETFPDVPSRWEMFAKRSKHLIVEQVRNMLKAELQRRRQVSTPPSRADLDYLKTSLHQEYSKRLQDMLHASLNVQRLPDMELELYFEGLLLEFSKDMKERFKVFAEAVARERKVAAEAAILDLVLPRPSVGLREMLEDIKSNAKKSFESALAGYRSSEENYIKAEIFKNFVTLPLDSLVLDVSKTNTERITTILRAAQSDAERVWTSTVFHPPYTTTELENFLKTLEESMWTAFLAGATAWKEEKLIYPEFMKVMSDNIAKRLHDYRSKNEAKVAELVGSTFMAARSEFITTVARLMYPMDDSAIDTAVKAAAAAAKEKIVGKVYKFSDTKHFKDNMESFERLVLGETRKAAEDNVRMWQAVFKAPLERADEQIKMIESKYILRERLENAARRICMEEINDAIANSNDSSIKNVSPSVIRAVLVSYTDNHPIIQIKLKIPVVSYIITLVMEFFGL